MRVALDTNRHVDLCRGQAATVEVGERADEVFLPFAVVAELRAGFALGKRGAENEAGLRRQGTPIPTNHLWIAALVLQHGLLLHARDAHFDHLPQLLRV